MSNTTNNIEQLAYMLAAEHKKTEPSICKIYWFPHDKEVYLIATEEGIAESCSGYVEPFFFDAAPEQSITAPSGIALILPREFGALKLPDSWGTWDDAVELQVA